MVIISVFSINNSTISDLGTSVAPMDTECKPVTLTKSYVKEGDNITLKHCASEDDGNVCKFKRGDDGYCFTIKDNKTQ